MRYKLVVRVERKRQELDLTEAEFDEIKKAKDKSFLLLGIEEKFDMVLENYAEYELDLLRIALYRMIHLDFAWSTSIQEIHLIDRRIANLLTVTRLYIDQVKQDLDELFGDSAIRKKFEVDLSLQYDSYLGYRVMEALRNNVQHGGLPVHVMSYPMTRGWDSTKNEPTTELRFSTVPTVDTELLGKRTFKAETLAELRAQGKSVPLTPFVRSYVECLGRVHETLRDEMATAASHCESVLSAAVSRSVSAFPGEQRGFVLAVQETDNQGEDTVVYVNNDQTVERRNALVLKNRSLSGLSGRYVTSLVDPGGMARKRTMGADSPTAKASRSGDELGP